MSARAIAMFVSVTALAIALPAAAQDGLAPADRQAIADVHHANQLEIQAGELAMRKGADPEVKRYGALLVRDHRRGDRLITEIAARRGLDPIPA